jgi:hypothetical protein
VRPYLKNNSSKKDWEGVIQVAEHLPGKQEALSSIPYTAKKKRKERRKDRKEGKEKRRESQKGSWKEGRKERKKEGRKERRKEDNSMLLPLLSSLSHLVCTDQTSFHRDHLRYRAGCKLKALLFTLFNPDL